MLKVCLVGVGGISGAHIPAWKNMSDAELTGICDIRPEQMEKYPEINRYTDFDEMIEKEKPDIVDICLPTFLHIEYSLKAIRRGINVICEKPVSLHRDDIEKVYGAAKENGVHFMIAQVLRFWPEYEFVEEVYRTGKYGKLLSGNMSRLSLRPKWTWDGWMTDEKRSGLVPFDLHIHDLDFMVWAFGKPVNAYRNRSKQPDQDYISATYEYDGFFINTEASWYNSPIPFEMSFRFQFEKAVIVFKEGKLTIYESNGNTILPGETSSADTGDISIPKSDAYANEIRYFTDAVINGTPADRVTPESLDTVLSLLDKF